MDVNPFLGIAFHAIGGLAAASFYIPYKQVRHWSWENYWLLGGIFSWIFAPILVAFAIVPHTFEVLREAPGNALLWTGLFGLLWGVGGLTFGLSMRYLGIALGYAIALGLCAAFGTLVPPLFRGEFGTILATTSGQVILLGVAVCLGGIALSGRAGALKERELSDEQKKATVQEFNFLKGLMVAIVAGALSAAMAFAFAAGKPIAELAVEKGAAPIWQNLPVLVVALLGGFVTNCVWCVTLMARNDTWREFLGQSARPAAPGPGQPVAPAPPRAPLLANYLFCALGGVAWYMQFFFYGMGETQMGAYGFSSWTLHMASIIVFSTLWGVALREWRGTSRRTRLWMTAGLMVLIISILIIGWGNTLAVGTNG